MLLPCTYATTGPSVWREARPARRLPPRGAMCKALATAQGHTKVATEHHGGYMVRGTIGALAVILAATRDSVPKVT